MLYFPRGNMASTHCPVTIFPFFHKNVSLFCFISSYTLFIHFKNMIQKWFLFIITGKVASLLALLFCPNVYLLFSQLPLPLLQCLLLWFHPIKHFALFSISLLDFQRKSIWLTYLTPLSYEQTFHVRPHQTITANLVIGSSWQWKHSLVILKKTFLW